jgi:hypothetical protein
MTAPIKFDFSDYTAAIFAISAIPDESAPAVNSKIAEIAGDYDDFQDDRRHCCDCLNIRNGLCVKQRFHPVDDIPRRCDDFIGLPEVAGMAR